MWGALFGPIGLAVSVVATGVAIASSSSGGGSSSNRGEVEENYKQEKKDDIKKEIKSFKESSISKIEQQYNTSVSFSNSNISIIKHNLLLDESIDKLEEETKAMEIFIQKLQKEYRETVI